MIELFMLSVVVEFLLFCYVNRLPYSGIVLMTMIIQILALIMREPDR